MRSQARWTLAAAAAAGAVGELVRRRVSARSPSPPRVARNAPLPPMTTQSSPGQIADLQQAYGADMSAESALPPGQGGTAG
ncbi:MAG TPA: hypothetical protein VFI54_24270 [Solirubrobacteraceae bacterium]|nr:hypothetical protein [Solirubrobacteraceae bacterium]